MPTGVYERTEYHIERLKEGQILRSGVNHERWKGEDAGYHSKHDYITRHKGKPEICSVCSSKENIQWANIDHKYSRNLDDYIGMCPLCHRKYDEENKLRIVKQYKNNKSGKTGVWLNKKTLKWIAEIKVNKNRFCLGTFKEKEEAIKAREDAESKYNK